MSLADKNRMYEILHKNDATRSQIEFAIHDLEEYGIFDDSDLVVTQEEFFLTKEEIINQLDVFTEKEYEIWYSSMPFIKKLKNIKNLKEEKRKIEQIIFGNIIDNEHEKRIIKKQKELIAAGIVPPDNDDNDDNTNNKSYSVLRYRRYGRSPLHEAIAMRDISKVREYVKQGKYLNHRDNNGHTPLEMAYCEGYTEVIKIITAYRREKILSQN